MACPHGSGSPTLCSQCRGARARNVRTNTDGMIVVDGKVKRPFQPPSWSRNGPPSRRGRRRGAPAGSGSMNPDDDDE